MCRAGPRGRAREWATLGVNTLSWLLSNNRLEEVCGTLTKGTFSSRLLPSNQDKGCTPSIFLPLALPLGPALHNLSTISTCYGDKYPSKYLFQENINLFNDVIHVYSWLVSWNKWASVPFLINFSCWKCADDGCLGTMVSLLIGLLYASLQLPLDNCKNKNSRNVWAKFAKISSGENFYLYSICFFILAFKNYKQKPVLRTGNLGSDLSQKTKQNKTKQKTKLNKK